MVVGPADVSLRETGERTGLVLPLEGVGQQKPISSLGTCALLRKTRNWRGLRNPHKSGLEKMLPREQFVQLISKLEWQLAVCVHLLQRTLKPQRERKAQDRPVPTSQTQIHVSRDPGTCCVGH